MSESFVTIRWNHVTFNIDRDSAGDWYVQWSEGDNTGISSGPDAPALISDACVSAGLDEQTKWEILFSLMNKLRERLFN